ncbi:transposase, partial [Bacillus cereus]|nr:transposase [Bacillus cereus]
KEFTLQSVRLIQEEGHSVAQVAREMGLHENTLYRWIAEFKNAGNQAFPGSGQLKPEDKALRDLQKRIRNLEEENDILKKAMHYFAKDRR